MTNYSTGALTLYKRKKNHSRVTVVYESLKHYLHRRAESVCLSLSSSFGFFADSVVVMFTGTDIFHVAFEAGIDQALIG